MLDGFSAGKGSTTLDKDKYDLITDKDEKIIEINNESLNTTIFNTYKKKVKK